MAKENIEVAVLFADVSGSTRLYETMGDATANRIIGKAIDVMAKITEAHHGHVIKTIGDEIMSRFATGNDAVRAAVSMQEEVTAGLKDETTEVMIKVGLHYGPAILMEDGDVFGDAVNVAARMGGIAKGTQIITTQETMYGLDADLQDLSRRFDKTSVRGKEHEIVVYQVVWETSDDVTRIEITADDLIEEVRCLHLNYAGTEITINSNDNRTFVIGRGVQSDLLCKARLASRTHAAIEFRRGKFWLMDQSSNGTFVETDDGERIFLRRQELMLWGHGTVGLGEEINKDGAGNLISYRCS